MVKTRGGVDEPSAELEFAPILSKKEAETRRAAATESAALMYLDQRRAGNEKASVKDCCDAAVAHSGHPRPAETSVRRLLPRFMTDAEKEEKKRGDARNDMRADATKRAVEIYRQTNGDGDGEVVMSVTKCCEAVEIEYGVRPAETSVRRLLSKMYEDLGIEPKKKKARPTPNATYLPDQEPDQQMVLPPADDVLLDLDSLDDMPPLPPLPLPEPDIDNIVAV